MFYSSKIPEVYEAIGYHAKTMKIEDGQLLFHDLYHRAHLSDVGFLARLRENKWLKAGVKNAEGLLVFSAYSRDQLTSIFPDSIEKIKLVKPYLEPELKPNNENDRDAVRFEYTKGDAYFLYAGPIHSAANLVNLLKGFSIFKKRLGSNMRLVLSGTLNKSANRFLHELSTYKYRDDVILTEKLSPEEEIKLMSTAYALVHPCRWDRFSMPVLMSMKLGVPVVVVDNSTHAELSGMAGMFFQENDPLDIGEKLIRIYRDEQIRADMIGTGLILANK